MTPELEMLKLAKTIAVVGLSGSIFRPSHGVAEYLQEHGFRIIPVNPNEEEILGEKAYARLEDIAEPVDVVDVFRRPEYTPDIVRSAIAIGAKGVWLQEGIVNEEAERLARDAGLLFTQDHCIMVEHRRQRA